MTMPSLITKYKEKETVTRLKKFYSSVSQAYIMAKNEYGTPDNWYENEAFGTQENADIMKNNITKYMNIAKDCGAEKGCFADLIYKKIDGNNTSNWNTHARISRVITSDGMSVFFYSYGNHPSVQGDGLLEKSFGAISVDVNGFKKPNSFGRDMFTFLMTKEGIAPCGTQLQKSESEDITFPNVCNRNNCQGWCEGCTAWVIYNENMDYLHCDDLSWDGKTKCK